MTILIRAPIRGLLCKYYVIDLSCPLVMIVKRRMNAYILCGDAVSDVTSSPSGDHSGYAYLHMPPLSN